MSTSRVIGDLEAAVAEVEDAEAAIEEVGEAEVRRVADAYERATSLLDRYEDTATGTGGETFRAYVQLQDEFPEFVEDIAGDLPRRGAFEEAQDVLDKRRLSEDDFERARRALAPARELAALLSERTDARERVREARRAAVRRKRELDERIEELESLLDLGEVDLDAPVEELHEPIGAYNDAVRDAFRRFKREAPARTVLELIETTGDYPLVPFREPPSDLATYVDDSPVGEEPIPTLLDYADHSVSKLGHYVDDPRELKRHVATNRTYLERLDAEPLTVDWPPPAAERLRWQIREFVSVVGRFAVERVVAHLHDLRDLTRRDRYGRLREAARAGAALGPAERERLASGEVSSELADAREEKERIEAALEEHPSP